MKRQYQVEAYGYSVPNKRKKYRTLIIWASGFVSAQNRATSIFKQTGFINAREIRVFKLV